MNESVRSFMNDLAQQALRVLDTTRTHVRAQAKARPFLWLGVAGFVVGWVVVIAGGRVGTGRNSIPLTDWLGLLSRDGNRPGYYWPGGIMLGAIFVLVLLWLVAIRINRPEQRCTEGTVWLMAGAWSLPFVVGPPLLSNDVYTYAAQGLMARHGFDAYVYGPSVLGDVPALAAVDPNWRSVPSPYGPLTTLVEHLAVAISGGSPLGAVLVFRALAVVCTVAIGLLAAELAGPRRVQALTTTVLNPLVLLHIVSAAHLEGVMIALLLGALVAGNERRWVFALVLACAAGAIKAPAYVAVLAIIAVHGYGAHGRFSWRTAARDSAVAGLAIGVTSLLVRNGLGWVKALNTPTLGRTDFAPASLLADLFSPIVQSASYDDRAAGGRITALLAAACIVGYLTVTANHRALNRTVGYGLLAVALLGPVVYPWYLLWGMLCLIPTARAARLDWLVMASGVACLFTPPGFTRSITNILTVVAVAIGLVWMIVRTRRRPAPRSAAASRQVSVVG